MVHILPRQKSQMPNTESLKTLKSSQGYTLTLFFYRTHSGSIKFPFNTEPTKRSRRITNLMLKKQVRSLIDEKLAKLCWLLKRFKKTKISLPKKYPTEKALPSKRLRLTHHKAKQICKTSLRS
jgi:hypothetical protein